MAAYTWPLDDSLARAYAHAAYVAGDAVGLAVLLAVLLYAARAACPHAAHPGCRGEPARVGRCYRCGAEGLGPAAFVREAVPPSPPAGGDGAAGPGVRKTDALAVRRKAG